MVSGATYPWSRGQSNLPHKTGTSDCFQVIPFGAWCGIMTLLHCSVGVNKGVREMVEDVSALIQDVG